MIRKISRKILSVFFSSKIIEAKPPLPEIKPQPEPSPEKTQSDRIRDYTRQQLGYEDLTDQEIEKSWSQAKKMIEDIFLNHNPNANQFAIPAPIGNELATSFAKVFLGRNRKDNNLIDQGLDGITDCKSVIENLVEKQYASTE